MYINQLSSDTIRDSLNTLSIHIDNSLSSTHVNECITELSTILDNVVSPLFKHNINHKVHIVQENDRITQHKWFTTECYDKRCSFYRMLNIYRNSKSEENRINMVKARTEYKKLTLRCRLEYEAIKTKQLTEARFKNAKLYWKMLKECAGVRKSNITLSAFKQYFKSVNNPNSPFFIPDDDISDFIERYKHNEFDVMFQEQNLPIHIVEVEKAIRELNINKSAGPDMYLNEFFIHEKMYLYHTC